jgi:predicted nucleotidyltransferase
MSLQERQDELIATHRAIQDADLPYVLVGGWAVSAFQTRFTTDVDMVLPESQVAEYDDLLRDLGYEKTFGSDISNVYEGRIVRYEKPVGDNAVQFDALVGAMRCRQTDAE